MLDALHKVTGDFQEGAKEDGTKCSILEIDNTILQDILDFCLPQDHERLKRINTLIEEGPDEDYVIAISEDDIAFYNDVLSECKAILEKSL